LKFLFHPRAVGEFDEIVRYYEGCQTGLGLEFAEEVLATIERLRAYPEAWSALSRNTRRCLVNRFPYQPVEKVKNTADSRKNHK
jgi:hypothetical protein